MLKTLFTALLFIATLFSIVAQEGVIIEGVVIDSLSGKKLEGANVIILPINKGVVSNNKGEFLITLAPGNYELQCSFMGYQPISKTYSVHDNISINIVLVKSSITVDDVDINAEALNDNVVSNKVGAVKLSSKEIDKLPGLLGEPDIIQSMKLTPGIQSGGEGNSGIYVRGGDAGQNLQLLDNMPLYNPSHLMGFFSVYNTDAIEDITVYKGGIPANYGGKTASVFDITMKEGNNDQFHMKGSVGLISSDLTINTPLLKDKCTLVISGRRTYLGLLQWGSSLFIKGGDNFFDNTEYYFYDASAKLSIRFNPKNKLYFTAFTGKDEYAFNETRYNINNQMNWGNQTMALRYNHLFNARFYTDAQVGVTKYNMGMQADFYQYNFNLASDISDVYARVDFTHLFDENQLLKYGVNYTYHTITPNKVDVLLDSYSYQSDYTFYSDEFSAYIQSEINMSKRLKTTLGLRYTNYRHLGPFTEYSLDDVGFVTDSTSYTKNEVIQNYHSLNPNLSMVYVINDESSLKGSASLTHQFIHLASVASVSLPTDLWLPSTSFIEPQYVGIASLGYFRNFLDNTLETSVETYYKKLYNQIDFKHGIMDNFDYKKLTSNMVSGEGTAYGIEFFVKKQMGDFNAWLSYTLSKTTRQFDELNNGNAFPAKYDRTHDLSLSLSYKLSEKWDFAAIFIYATGNAMTLPAGRYMIQGNIANHYTEVNSYRMPVYHRLDVSANYRFKKKGRYESFLNFSIFNTYNRANPYFFYFSAKGDLNSYSLEVKANQISLFPIVPSISYHFKF